MTERPIYSIQGAAEWLQWKGEVSPYVTRVKQTTLGYVGPQFVRGSA